MEQIFVGDNQEYLNLLFYRFFDEFQLGHLLLAVGIFCGTYLLLLGVQRRLGCSDGTRRIRFRSCAGAGLMVYLYLIVLYAIVFRPVNEFSRHAKLFWSYRLALDGYGYMWIEIVLNYIFLLPVGVIVPLFLRRHVLAVTIGVGFVISLTIEVVQLISCRGLFEFDDIIGNVLGVIVGYGLHCLPTLIGIISENKN